MYSDGLPQGGKESCDGSNTTTSPVIECTNVTRAYHRGGTTGRLSTGHSSRSEVLALDSVTCAFNRGEFVGITGPSGSGKSTLLHIMAGLDTPTTGRVKLAGDPISKLSERERSRIRLSHVGIVFQQFHLLPSLPALQNVAIPLIEQGMPKRSRRHLASNLLEDVGLGDRMDHRPGELSGGEQQRVAIARALSTDPLVVLADEPTGELDTTTGSRIIDLLNSMADDRAVVVASHDDAVIKAVDRVITLRDGRIER